MNDAYGITALDPTIGLLRKELDMNNVPQGQEPQYFQSKGRPLSAQLLSLIQANKMLQQQAQMAQNQPPQSTVAADLMRGQPMPQAQPAGLAALPPISQPAPNPRQQGIANLPQEAVGTKAMASGGIVAFDEGGDVRHFEEGGDISSQISKLEAAIKADDYIKQGVGGSLGRMISSRTMPMGYADRKATEAKLNQLKAANSMFAGAPATAPAALSTPLAIPGNAYAPPPGKIGGRAVAPMEAAPPAPVAPSPVPAVPRASIPAVTKPEAQQPDAVRDYLLSLVNATPQENAGLAAAQKARADALDVRRQNTLDLMKKDAADKKRDFMMQLAQAAFGSVGKGRTLAQGLGIAGANFAQGAMDINKEYRGIEQGRKQAMDQLEDAKLAMREAEEARKAGDYEKERAFKTQAAIALGKYNVDARTADQGDVRNKIAAREVDLRALALNEEAAHHANQIQLGREELKSREGIALLETGVRSMGKTIPPDKIGKALTELESSDLMAQWIKTQVAARGKNVVNDPNFVAAKNKKLQELFFDYYGGGILGQSNGGGAMPPEVLAARDKHK